MDYKAFFKTLTGFRPHPYQERIADELLRGRSVILSVPTGAGKTWAAVAPFLYTLANGTRMADRLLYALPLRSLATSLHTTTLEKMRGVFDRVRTFGKNRDYLKTSPSCSLQIGGQEDDPFFEADVVFTTIDQLLSGYVFLPVSLPDRLGNINAGSLLGSLVVFDEVHLLDPSVALGTVIEMFDRLRGLCQFVLMTATMSNDAVDWLARKLDCVPLTITDDEIRALPSQSTKRRSWRWSANPLDAATVKAKHNGGRTIALLNSVKHAQNLFLDLERLYADEATRPELLLLHSRFYPEDRKFVEDQLPAYFGPATTRTNVILVTTQVIEAGLDISADHLHTELAPMNALVQRAGRTARFSERNTGTVTIYDVAQLGPYHDDKKLVDATRATVAGLPIEGELVDFINEREWVSSVHARDECEQLAQYANLFARRQAVHEAMDLGNRGRLTDLVRDIDSVGVLISCNPEKIDFRDRSWPRTLGIPGVSLMSLRSAFSGLPADGWVAKGAFEKAEDERPGTSIEWQTLSPNQLRSQWLIAIHPDFATYHPRLGLRIGVGGPAPDLGYNSSPGLAPYNYQFEPWVHHSTCILRHAVLMTAANPRAVEYLANRYSTSSEMIEELVRIAVTLHDAGKLATEWQQKAWQWQDDKDARMRAEGVLIPERERVALAHTSYSSQTDRKWRNDPKYRFPPHAVQGAFVVAVTIEQHCCGKVGDDLGPLAAACVYTAISRHHGARTKECRGFTLAIGAETLLRDSFEPLRYASATRCDSPAGGQFSDRLLTFTRDEDEEGWALYSFLVRLLRLSDQRATQCPL